MTTGTRPTSGEVEAGEIWDAVETVLTASGPPGRIGVRRSGKELIRERTPLRTAFIWRSRTHTLLIRWRDPLIGSQPNRMVSSSRQTIHKPPLTGNEGQLYRESLPPAGKGRKSHRREQHRSRRQGDPNGRRKRLMVEAHPPAGDPCLRAGRWRLIKSIHAINASR